MGVMRFLVHPPDSPQPWPDCEMAYLSGLDNRIFPARIQVEENQFSCLRSMSDSAKLNIPWPVPGFGQPVLRTTSLRDREEPYLLPLELARGELSELRDQWAGWAMSGMAIPDAFLDLQRQAFHRFAQASASQTDPGTAGQLARESIELTCRASAILLDAYVIQRMAHLRKAIHHSPGLLGCVLDREVLSPGHALLFHDAFNAASLPIRWREIEPVEGEYHWEESEALLQFCLDQRMIVRSGPLIDLGPDGMPAWLAPWKNDFLNLPSFVCDFIETAISKFQGHLRIWELAASGNTGGALDLSEDHRLALVARVLEAAKRTDSDAQYFIRIDRPWGEYQRDGLFRLAPFQFVDALLRSNLGLTGVVLEINAGYGPPGCLARSMLSISKLIDFWSLLGVQIHVDLACPSSTAHDPLSDSRYQVQQTAWKEDWSEELQAEWIECVVPLLMAKPSVTGVFLSHFSDAAPHRYPHAGLLTPAGNPKRLIETLRRQRRQELG